MNTDKPESNLIFCWMPIIGLVHTWKCRKQLKPVFFYLGITYGKLSIILAIAILFRHI